MKDLKVLFLSVVGSHIYGLNHEGSDYDFKGFGYVDDDYYRYGIKNFEQTESMLDAPYEIKEMIENRYHMSERPELFKDFVVYDIKKFVSLALANNPTIMELLFVDEKWIIKSSPQYEILRSIRKEFLSGRVLKSYVGYATAQLIRLKNHKRWIDSPPVYPERNSYGLPKQPKIPKDHLVTASLLPKELLSPDIADEVHLERQYTEDLKHYNNYMTWKENRNKERAELEAKTGYDTKHGGHTARLLLQGEEILNTGNLTVDVSKTENFKFISDIKSGFVSYDELVDWAEKKFIELKGRAEKSMLPDYPDLNKINEILLKIVKEAE